MLAQVDERRQPRTNTTVAQLVERHLAEAQLEANTLSTYRGYVDKHILPFLGREKVGSLEADVLDSFYAELRRCRDHCSERGGVDHRTPRKHECDERCRPHVCRPLAASTVRQIHFILSGAFKRAVRWRWVAVNPIASGEPPSAPKPNPKPPKPAEAAQIINEAWKDPDWGTLVWLTMVTGLRRGELCALRWRHVDLSSGVLHVERSIGQRDGRAWEKDIKTHQQRRITLDRDTVLLLQEHLERCQSRASMLGAELSQDAFVFSRASDGSTHLLPNSVSYRYGLLARRLGIATTLHKLRHYSATELIAGGVDIRTVAGRLGHGSGGVTTLRVYAAWVSESDQRAAGNLAARMPPRPAPAVPSQPVEHAAFDPSSPHEVVAVSLRDQIMDGSLPAGLPVPPVKQIASDHSVSVGTAQRALELLKKWGLVEAHRGRRNLVRRPAGPAVEVDIDATASNKNAASEEPGLHPESLDLEIRRLGRVVSKLRTVADPADHDTLGRLLAGAVKRDGKPGSEIDAYDMVVRRAGEQDVLLTFVATASGGSFRPE